MDWFLYAVLLSFSASTFVLSMRAITPQTNPFLFMALAGGLATILLGVYCVFAGISLSLPALIIGVGLLAGVFVGLLDLGFLMMFRRGAPVSLAVPLVRISSILISALVGVVFYTENLNATKMLGIILACLAVYLLTRPVVKKG
jgi:drug/metabolite transporter (DMT)-like permease